MRAEPHKTPNFTFFDELWTVEKPKMTESFPVIELGTDAFNKFCDDLEYDKPPYLEKQGLKPEQVRDAHAVYIPPGQWANPFHITLKTGKKTGIFMMLADDDKAKFVVIRIIQFMNLKYKGMDLDHEQLQ
jgi:hypothetical protein